MLLFIYVFSFYSYCTSGPLDLGCNMCFETFLVIKTHFPLSFCNSRKKKKKKKTFRCCYYSCMQNYLSIYKKLISVVIRLVVSVVVICAKGYSIVGTSVTCE